MTPMDGPKPFIDVTYPTNFQTSLTTSPSDPHLETHLLSPEHFYRETFHQLHSTHTLSTTDRKSVV